MVGARLDSGGWCRRSTNGPAAGEAFERLIDAFYDRVEADDLLAPFFPGGVHAAHRDHVAAWWSEVFGGRRATPRSSAPTSNAAKHRDLGITAEQRFRFASLMSLPPTTPACPTTPSFAPRSSPTSSGARAWRCTTPSPGAPSRRTAGPALGLGEAPPYVP